MSKPKKTIEVRVERMIPAPVGKVFDAWLNPKRPGTPWSMGDKVILNPEVDGLFFWGIGGTPHYGRFTKVERPGRIHHTWMSPNTGGLESKVVVTFKKKGDGTLMSLVHSGLPSTAPGRSHDKGWNYILGAFLKKFE